MLPRVETKASCFGIKTRVLEGTKNHSLFILMSLCEVLRKWNLVGENWLYFCLLFPLRYAYNLTQQSLAWVSLQRSYTGILAEMTTSRVCLKNFTNTSAMFVPCKMQPHLFTSTYKYIAGIRRKKLRISKNGFYQKVKLWIFAWITQHPHASQK